MDKSDEAGDVIFSGGGGMDGNMITTMDPESTNTPKMASRHEGRGDEKSFSSD